MLRIEVALAVLCTLTSACKTEAPLEEDAAVQDLETPVPDDSTPREDGRSKADSPSAAPVTLVGAGDIAWCEPPGVGNGEQTAKLLDAIPGAAVFTTGDNSNGNGSTAEYTGCFGPSWGRHLARIRPAPGNHDYTSALLGADYHKYFGAAAGPAGKGYYSYDLGAWHIVVLNSECNLVSCAAGGEQEKWLRADLAAHPARCTLAIFHRPHFSYSSPAGSSYTRAIFAALHEAGVDVLLTGHYHWYERFKPQGPSGAVDTARGVRQFIVGTGGSFQMVNSSGWVANSETHLDSVFGVLKLTLEASGYEWRFVPEAGKESQTDSGRDVCH